MTSLDEPTESEQQKAEEPKTDEGPVPLAEIIPQVLSEIELRRLRHEAAVELRKIFD